MTQWDNVMLYCYFNSLINTTSYTLTLSAPLSCSIRFRPRNYLAGNLLVVAVHKLSEFINSVSQFSQSQLLHSRGPFYRRSWKSESWSERWLKRIFISRMQWWIPTWGYVWSLASRDKNNVPDSGIWECWKTVLATWPSHQYLCYKRNSKQQVLRASVKSH